MWFDDFEITHKQSDDKINVTSWTDYYPYGKVAKTSCPLNGAYRYGYQGEFAEKEEDWNSFELRQYDSEIGRFLSVDPMGEFWSSYVGMGNDPVNLTDPTGGCTDCPDNDPPAGWGQGYMIDEVVVTPQTSNIIANNQAFMQQMADFNSKYVPKPELPIRYSMGSPSTGAIEQSYPEEFLMPDVPFLWVVGKFGKAAAKYSGKIIMRGVGGGSMIDIYRAVSKAEYDDFILRGYMRAGTGYEGKLFTNTLGEANTFASELGHPHIIKATIPSSFYHKLFHFEADGKSAIGIDRDYLDELNDVANFDIIR